MAISKSNDQSQHSELVYYLRTRLEIILNKWRTACAADPRLTSKESFSRDEFNDQVPLLLNILLQRINQEAEMEDPVLLASEHGLHRWQAGYSLTELIVELEIIFNIFLDDLQSFKPAGTAWSPDALSRIYRETFRIYNEAIQGSVSYYHELRQTAAAEQAASLQNALEQLQQLTKQRSEHLRHSSHDLRSSFSVLMMATQLLEMPASEKERAELTRMLNNNLSSIRDMLFQLTDYARIEAGQEVLKIKKFDVATLIKETVTAAQPLAEQRNLFLQCEGLPQLEVKSDPVLIQRILQNLLHNALKYTRSGGIYVTWAQEHDARWILSVQDTGPGFPVNSPTALLADQLKPPLHTSSALLQDKALQLPPPVETVLSKGHFQMKESEGLGLFIVKRICELLKASMDIESSPETGTLIRIRFVSKPLSKGTS